MKPQLINETKTTTKQIRQKQFSFKKFFDYLQIYELWLRCYGLNYNKENLKAKNYLKKKNHLKWYKYICYLKNYIKRIEENKLKKKYKQQNQDLKMKMLHAHHNNCKYRK